MWDLQQTLSLCVRPLHDHPASPHAFVNIPNWSIARQSSLLHIKNSEFNIWCLKSVGEFPAVPSNKRSLHVFLHVPACSPDWEYCENGWMLSHPQMSSTTLSPSFARFLSILGDSRVKPRSAKPLSHCHIQVLIIQSEVWVRVRKSL